MKVPTHRRKKDQFKRHIPGVLKLPPKRRAEPELPAVPETDDKSAPKETEVDG